MICRHYFSVMLQTSQARFHIGLLNQCWFISNQLDLKNRPFYPVTRFEIDSEIPFLDLNTSASTRF